MMKRKTCACAVWALTALWAGFIFYMSSRVASESAQMSGGLLEWLSKYFGATLTEFFVRKCAHAFEFSILCGFLCAAFYATLGSVKILYSVGITVVYAISDEIHQLFVQGRACRVFDVFVDFCGALVMAAFVAVVILIVNKKISKKDLF